MTLHEGVEQRERERPLSTLYDDTEEMLVGADWHQLAIGQIAFGLRDLARRHALPWHVGNQLTLSGPRDDGRMWRPSPDVSLHTSAGPGLRADLDIVAEGPPALLIEVLSPSTWHNDLLRPEPPAYKRYGYLEVWGVAEYLVFDPQREHLPEQCQGWRRVGGRTEEWTPTVQGRYESRLGLSFAPENIFLRVYDFDGTPVAFDFEQADQRIEAERARAAAEQRAHVEAAQRIEAEGARAAAEQRAEALEILVRQLRGDC